MATHAERVPADAGQRAAFAALADEQLEGAYRLAAVILGDPFEARDATHDAVVAAWRAYHQLRDPERFAAWFQRILVNTCRGRLRRRRRQVTGIEAAPDMAAESDAYRRVDDRVALDRACASLSADQQVVVALRFYADQSIDAIAELLRIPAGTVKSRLHAATKRLQRALEEVDR